MVASLPEPENPSGTSSGEVTPRYNFKPTATRWAGGVAGTDSNSRKRQHTNTSEDVVVVDQDFQPPTSLRKLRHRVDALDSADDPSAEVAHAKGRSKLNMASDKLNRQVKSLQQSCKDLRADVKRLEKEKDTKDNALNTLKAERLAEKEVAAVLKEQMKTAQKMTKIDDKDLRELINGNQEIVLRRIDALTE